MNNETAHSDLVDNSQDGVNNNNYNAESNQEGSLGPEQANSDNGSTQISTNG